MKLVQKAFLLLAIPLCLELCLFLLLMQTLQQSETDNRALSNVGTALVYINRVLFDTATVAEDFLMSKTLSDSQLSAQVRDLMSDLDEHRRQLRQFSTDHPDESKDLAVFDALIGNFTDLVVEAGDAYSSGGVVGNTRAIGKLRSYTRRIVSEGNEIVERHVTARKALMERRKADSQRLELLLTAFAIVFVVAPLFLAGLLGTTFRKRLNKLVSNTELIAMERPLPAPMSGRDELALFDSVIHKLSNELAVIRRQERALLDNTGDIIMSLDDQLKVREVNRAVEHVLGVDQSQVLGAAIQSFVLEDDRSNTFGALRAAMSDSLDATFESRMTKRGSTPIYALWNVRWSPADGLYFCVIHDYTKAKEAELLREEVLAMVSHDLRSPLANVRISMELLGDGALGELSEPAQKVVIGAEQSIQSLITMINDLLEVKRMEFGGSSFDMKPGGLGELFERAVAMLDKEAERKKIDVSVTTVTGVATMDSERILRVILNLLGNAIKFSPLGSSVKLSCEPQRVVNEDWLKISVVDEGPGVSPEMSERIFEKFRQAGTVDAGEKEGTGLGLAICKAIVEAHGGRIGVENASEKGSIFWFAIPCKQPSR